MIILLLFSPIPIHAQFGGGTSDGAEANEINVTRLDGILLQVPYHGGIGNGFDLTLYSGLLNNIDISSLYRGGAGDGDNFEVLHSYLDQNGYNHLFNGGTGDGSEFAKKEYTLSGQSLSSLYNGGIGDGANFISMHQFISSEYLIFAGGQGDGQDQIHAHFSLSSPEWANIFAGGDGDGHDDFKSDPLSFPAGNCLPGNRLFVDQDAIGTQSGQMWSNAISSLPFAFENARHCPIGEIWVAEGIYLVTENNDRSISLKPPSEVSIYGGFNGNETNIVQRNWVDNQTIISGDIGIAGTSTDNSLHVIDLSNTSGNTILDGFIIEHGNADVLNEGTEGAGIYNKGSRQGQNVVIKNSTIRECFSLLDGSAIFMRGKQTNLSLVDLDILGENSSERALIHVVKGNLSVNQVVVRIVN